MNTTAKLSLWAATASLGAAISTGCTTTGATGAANAPQLHRLPTAARVVDNLDNWYLIQRDPPIAYPLGVQLDAETGSLDGQWVTAGPSGLRWFVPSSGANGVSANDLLSESLAARTPSQIQEQETFERNHKIVKALVITSTRVPAAVALVGAVAVAGGDPALVNLDGWWE